MNLNKVNESEIDNSLERMQQPLLSDHFKEEFKNIITQQAIRYTKSCFLFICEASEAVPTKIQLRWLRKFV